MPKIKPPRAAIRQKAMRGRPITGEEFERMIAATSSVVGESASASWVHLLQGLWLSGLRLGESLELFWDRSDKIHIQNLDGRRPLFQFWAELQKGQRDPLTPVAPEFAIYLRQTPLGHRHGPIFEPEGRTKIIRSADRAGRILSDIGKRAGVVVDVDRKTGHVKHASAPDLRRSFGERWSVRVMPAVLQELMRHRSIVTTMKYYVGRNANRTANEVWGAYHGTRDGDQNNGPHHEGARLGDMPETDEAAI